MASQEVERSGRWGSVSEVLYHTSKPEFDRPEFDPQNLHKTLGILVCIGNLSMKAAEAETLGAHWLARPSLIGESQSPMRAPSVLSNLHISEKTSGAQAQWLGENC